MSATTKDVGLTEVTHADGGEFAKPSSSTYNLNHGRVASAPTVGGDSHGNRSPKGYAPGAPGSKSNTTSDMD